VSGYNQAYNSSSLVALLVSGGTETDAVTFLPPCFMTSAERLFHFLLGEESLIAVPVLSSPSVSGISSLISLKT